MIMSSMLYTATANGNLQRVSEGMMEIMNSFDKLDTKLTNGEKAAAIIGCFHAIVTGPLKEECSSSDLIQIGWKMRSEAKRLKKSAYAGAVAYVQRELQDY